MEISITQILHREVKGMLDNQLFQLFLPILQTQLPLYGILGAIAKQTNQPTMQGVNTQPTVYVYKVSDHRYGFLHRSDFWNVAQSQMIHTETQQYETRFTLSALVLQNPLTPNQYTASDVVNTCAAIMQSDSTRIILAQSNVGILRIEDVSNPYFTDDRDNYEASPSFDFILTHRQTRTTTDPVVNSFEVNINSV